MKFKSYAKINLTLKVFPKRPDGYHNIDSIMQTISLHDEITLESIPSGIEILCDHPSVPTDEKNIVYKIIKKLMSLRPSSLVPHSSSGINVLIKKNIPVAAGLGGGSSNAAAVLKGLNELWGLNLSMDEMMKIGAEAGSDVPFFLIGGRARCTGRGEIVENLPDLPKKHILIVNPGFPVSTADVYQAFDEIGSSDSLNDLEKVVFQKYPELEKLKDQLIKFGAEIAQMSGSGPTCFGFFESKLKAKDVYHQFRKKIPLVFLTETLS